MGKYEETVKRPRQFLAMTGYTVEEFEHLAPTFGECFYDHMETYRLDGKLRGKRPYVDYKNSPLPTVEDKLFFILSYLKTNNLQEVHGSLFGMGQPKANQWIHCLQIVLMQTLNWEGCLPARDMADVEMETDGEQIYYHDGTERPIQRPSDAQERSKNYSGKKNNTRSKITSLSISHVRYCF